jgi:tetratricopeptide (TPR) repeat protein
LNTEIELQKALSHHQAGRLAEAGEIYKAILTENPNNVDALNLMGVIVQAAGNLEAAISLIARATQLAPDYAAPFLNLGNVLTQAGRLEEAVPAFTKALELAPQLGAAHNGKGNALAGLGRPEEAVACYGKAIELEPTDSDAHFNLGNALSDLGHLDKALASYRQSVLLDQSHGEKYYNLANTAAGLYLFEEALENFDHAIRLNPEHLDAHCNRGAVLQKMGRTREAVESLDKVLQHQPDSPDLHWNIALALLQGGEYRRGWREYEWRWNRPEFGTKRPFPMPEWNGEDLAGKDILVASEQGFGDAIQFSRFVPLLAERGARVVLECKPQLAPVMDTLAGVDQIINLGDPIPATDFCVQNMSLPRLFDVTLENLPARIPYLSVPPETPVDQRLSDAQEMKIGIVWAGGTVREDNFRRSCEVTDFAPLFTIPGSHFFSLQVGPFQDDLKNLDDAANLTDLAESLTDFARTAAAIDALDLVISVDTAVLHLAGALGKTAWGLMSEPTGFFWMNQRRDSPWYPTTTLYRQPRRDDWDSVFRAVENDLRKRVAGEKD